MPVDLNALLDVSLADLANTNPADSLASTQSMTKALVAGAKATKAGTTAVANVAVDAANNADKLQQEAADAGYKTAVDVLAMWDKTQKATALSVNQTQEYLVQAATLESEAQQLEDNAPSLFSNPLGAITSSWKAAGKRADAQERRGTADRMMSSINGVLQMSRVQMEDTIAARGLQDNALIAKRAAELNKGLAAARIEAETNLQQAAITSNTAGKIYEVQRNHQNWLLDQSRLLIAQKDLAMRGKEFDLKLKEWNRNEADRAMLEQNLSNVAYTIALTRKGSTPTESEIIAARAQAEALFKGDPSTFGQFSMYGNEIKTVGSTLGFKGAIEKGSVGLIQSLGQVSGNAQLSNFGADLYQQQYATTVESLYEQRARAANIDPANKQAYEMWKRGLAGGEKSAIEKNAQKLAAETVRDMPVTSYMHGKTAKYALPSNGINTIGLSDPASVEHYYGYKLGTKENAALANPQFRSAVQNAQTTGGSNGLVAGAAAAVDWLKKAGIKNPYKLLTKMYGNAIEGIIQTDDPEYKFLRSHIRVQPKANVQLDGASYDMADPVWLERAVLRYKNPPKSFMQSATGNVAATGASQAVFTSFGRIGGITGELGNLAGNAGGSSVELVQNAITSGLEFRANAVDAGTEKISQWAALSDGMHTEKAAKLQQQGRQQQVPVKTQMAADGSTVATYADGSTEVIAPPPSSNAPTYNLQTMPTSVRPAATVKQQPPQIQADQIVKQEQLADGTIYTVYKSGRTNYKAPAPSYNLQTMPEPHLRNLWDD